VRKALERLLRSVGLMVVPYSSGEEFLRAIPEHAPDFLLLDVQLPGLSGLEVQAQLNHARLAMPVVFITATEVAGLREQALSSGAAAWLPKPVDQKLLLEAIHVALAAAHRPKTS